MVTTPATAAASAAAATRTGKLAGAVGPVMREAEGCKVCCWCSSCFFLLLLTFNSSTITSICQPSWLEAAAFSLNAPARPSSVLVCPPAAATSAVGTAHPFDNDSRCTKTPFFKATAQSQLLFPSSPGKTAAAFSRPTVTATTPAISHATPPLAISNAATAPGRLSSLTAATELEAKTTKEQQGQTAQKQVPFPSPAPTASSHISPYVGQMLLEDMLLGRYLEEAVFRLYYAGKTAGFVHLYSGQEAVSTGVIKLLRNSDAVVSTYREHVHASSKGVSAHRIFAELFGSSSGCSKGRGGSMHLFSKPNNFVGGFAFIGEQIPIAMGFAYSQIYRKLSLLTDQLAGTDLAAGEEMAGTAALEQKHDQVTVCFLGDGTTNIGQLYEALNIAALAKLPIIFVVENNNWAIGMAAQRSTAIPRVWQRAEAFGVVGKEVDGMNVLAVRAAAAAAIDRARRGEGPTLIEALTYRFRGHSVADPDELRTPTQREAWAVRDPIETYENYLKSVGYANDESLALTKKKVAALIDEAVKFAEKSPASPVEECGDFIFAPTTAAAAAGTSAHQQQLTIAEKEAYAAALKEELDYKARVRAGDRTPRPSILLSSNPPIDID